MTAAVVVVSYGSSGLVDDNLPDLPTGFTVVLVDNFSDDAERARAAAVAARRGWEFLGQPNVGFGGGVNAGCRRALELGCTELVLLNPDARATADDLERLAAAVRSEPSRLVSPRLVDSSGKTVFRGSTLDLTTGHLRGGWVDAPTATTVNWLSGACLALSAEVSTRLGGMAEHLFLYWEDVDLSWRAVQAGFTLAVMHDVTVVHDEGGTHGSSTSGRARSDLYYYWNTRNRLVFAADHLTAAQVRSWLRSTARESTQIWLRGGRRQLLHHPAGAWAAVKGSLAGVSRALPAAVPGRRRTRRARSAAAGFAMTGADHPRTRVLIAHPSPDLYGSDRVLVDTARAFVEAGAEVTVTLPALGPLVPLLEQQGATVTRCPSPVVRKSALSVTGLIGWGAEVLGAIGPVLRLMRRTRPDLVLVNTVTIPVWLVLPRLLGTRVVCHVHEAEGGQRAIIKRLLYAPLMAAHQLVVNSHYALDVLAGAWPVLRGRSSVIDNPVPGPPGDPAPLRTSCDDPRLLFIGRISPRKGPQVAVDALALLRERGVPAHLDLLGAVFPGYEWFERDLRKQVGRLGLDEHVTWLGFRADVWGEIADRDIVVVPSVADEPFGNTAVEAMLAGRPLVVSDTSGLKEAAAGYACARRVAPDNPRAIADAVVDLSENWTTVRASIEADRGRAAARHSPGAYRHALVDLLLPEAR